MDEATSKPATAMGMTRRFALVSWLAVVVWAGLIFYMSTNSGDDLHEGMGLFSTVYEALMAAQEQLLGEGVDVLSPLAHFCEYTVFGALLCNALRCHMPLRRAVVVAVVCASAYGVTDEIHQLFVPDRMCDPLDWVVDTIGGLTGALLLRFAALRRK